MYNNNKSKASSIHMAIHDNIKQVKHYKQVNDMGYGAGISKAYK